MIGSSTLIAINAAKADGSGVTAFVSLVGLFLVILVVVIVVIVKKHRDK